MRIKNFKATFFAKQYPRIRFWESHPEPLFESAVDEVVPPLAILRFHVVKVFTWSHGYHMEIPEPLEFSFKLYHGK